MAHLVTVRGADFEEARLNGCGEQVKLHGSDAVLHCTHGAVGEEFGRIAAGVLVVVLPAAAVTEEQMTIDSRGVAGAQCEKVAGVVDPRGVGRDRDNVVNVEV